MPNNNATNETHLDLTEGELAALRGIVRDWINEEIALEPYPDDFTSLIGKLSLPEEAAAPMPQTTPRRVSQA